MAETRRLGLTLLEAGQAQKHATVNTALARLDGFGGAAALSRSLAVPPDPVEGALYLPAAGASGGWAGRTGLLALADNGGWAFAVPERGRRLFVIDEAVELIFDGAGWVETTAPPVVGAGTALRVVSLDHVVTPGAQSVTAPLIPDKAIVFGVTARVIAPITGAGLTGWSLGAEGAPGRYGAGHGLEAGAEAVGVSGAPVAYYGPSALVLDAEGGAFAGGVVRLCAHLLTLGPPRLS